MIWLKHQKLLSCTFYSSTANKRHWQGYQQACSQMEVLKNCDQKATKDKITSYLRSIKTKQWRPQKLKTCPFCWHIVNHSTLVWLTTSMNPDIPSKNYQKREKVQIEKAKKRIQRFWEPSYWRVEQLRRAPFPRSSHPDRRTTNTGRADINQEQKKFVTWESPEETFA